MIEATMPLATMKTIVVYTHYDSKSAFDFLEVANLSQFVIWHLLCVYQPKQIHMK